MRALPVKNSISQSVTAPEPTRTEVKLAASIEPCASDKRQSTEFAANASIAMAVRLMVRGVGRYDDLVMPSIVSNATKSEAPKTRGRFEDIRAAARSAGRLRS